MKCVDSERFSQTCPEVSFPFQNSAMKIKMLTRNPNDYMRETIHDVHKVPRNYNPVVHPFQTEREYTRALNSTKLERVFAKPFLCSLSGHTDGVYRMCKHPTSLTTLISGSGDGEIIFWNLATRQKLRMIQVWGRSYRYRTVCVAAL